MIKKNNFFEECSWFKFNILGMAGGMVLKFYTSITKGLKLKARKLWRLIPMFVEVSRETLAFLSPVLTKVMHDNCIVKFSLMPTIPIILILWKNPLLKKTFYAAISITKLSLYIAYNHFSVFSMSGINEMMPAYLR